VWRCRCAGAGAGGCAGAGIRFTGEMKIGLATEHWRRVARLPATSDERLCAAGDLAVALYAQEDFVEAGDVTIRHISIITGLRPRLDRSLTLKPFQYGFT
jgi:hypothetical protein